MIMGKVELLAPAGSYEAFLGAIHAGADAVYLGGSRFGARAFAQNFQTEELCEAIRYAHLFNRKVYLTLNTLVKEKEFSEIYSYLLPFADAGLDAVIVQDLGVFQFIKQNFNQLAIHASTQMAIMGYMGAKELKELGAERIVPARELHIEEIRRIKEHTQIEVETFIHGAMCYCYSGQCLFSSILGGRSGNRGKCAQPCRLPYQIVREGKSLGNREQYPLSLKDQCTLENIPEMIQAGIDSFKIEGRMKKPEYVAGVTSIYRKVIDRYMENPAKTPFLEEDLEELRTLYIRSEIQDGYYHKHHGKDMVTLTKPGYSKSDEAKLQRIRQKFLDVSLKLPVQMEIYCFKGKSLSLSISHKDCSVTIEKGLVEAALKQPMEQSAIEKQLKKLGNTPFEIEKLFVHMEHDVFIPVKELNEIRREAAEALCDAILKQKGDSVNSSNKPVYSVIEKNISTKKELFVSVETREQLEAVIPYLPKLQRIYIPKELIDFLPETTQMHTRIFLALPFILRAEKKSLYAEIKENLKNPKISGCLVRNFEEIALLKEIRYQGSWGADSGLYCWNREAYAFWKKSFDTICLPYELNRCEKEELGTRDFEEIIYGRIPMMITANCIANTGYQCEKENLKKSYVLKDRYQKEFPVSFHCEACYNIIWNSCPMSLHKRLEGRDLWYAHSRISFTTEGQKEVTALLEYFTGLFEQQKVVEFPLKEYTNGHEKRGVE